MDQCPQCGAQTRPDDNFCLFCGSPLGGPVGSVASAAWQRGQQAGMPSMADAAGSKGTTLDYGMPAEFHAPSDPRSQSAASMAATNGAGDPGAALSPNSFHAFLMIATLPNQPRIALDKPEMYIGRLQRSDVVLPNDKLVSRRHAMVQVENGVFTLFDLGSSNGTFVNGRELFAPVQLQHGDRINIGEHELIFQIVEQSETVALPFQSYAAAPAPAREEVPEAPVEAAPDTMRPGWLAEDVALPASETAADVDEVAPPAREIAPAVSEPLPAAPERAPAADEPEPPMEVIPAPPVAPMVTREFTSPEVATIGPIIEETRALLPAIETLRQQSQTLSQALDAMAGLVRDHDSAVSQAASLHSGVMQVAAQLVAALEPIDRFHESEDYALLSDLVKRLSAQPRDIEVLAEFARQTAALEQLLTMHEQLHQTVQACRASLTQLL
jgi:hypothetical protein